MKIRMKASLLAAGLALFFIASMVAMIAYTTSTRFLDLELSMARQDLERVEKAISRKMEATISSAKDYARWDDTWLFATGALPDYAEINFIDSTYSNLRLDMIAVYDAYGHRLYGSYIDDNGEIRPWDELAESLGDAPWVKEIVAAGSGFASTGRGVVMASAMPILHSDSSGPEAGIIVMGAFLDDGTLADLALVTGVPMKGSYASAPESGNRQEPAKDFTYSATSDKIQGRLLLFSPGGEPVLAIMTTTIRHLFIQGAAIIRDLVVIGLAMGLLLTLLSRMAFQTWLFLPLSRLEKALDTVGKLEPAASGYAFKQLANHDDEVGHVAKVLQSMNARVAEAHERIRQANADLEGKVRERTAALEQANIHMSLYQKILEGTSEAVVVTDLDGTIVEVNDAACRTSGWSRDELLGQNPRILKSERTNEEIYRSMWSAIAERGRWSGELWNKHRNGAVYPVWLSINTIVDSEGRPLRHVGISTDISLVKESEERLHRLAYFDTLTGLPNRALFTDRLERTIAHARRGSTIAALIFIDLDRFKNVNDSLGHAAGDKLLVEFSARLRSRLRETDTLCRLGGDEFTVILEEIAHEGDAAMIAQAIMQTMTEPFVIDENEVFGSASLGIALFPRDGTDSDTIIKKADAAMYQAKESGRGTWRFASPEMDVDALRRMETEAKLHGALDRGEFRLYYQPQLSLPGSSSTEERIITGAEALIRWLPGDGVVTEPGSFIDIAEDTGLITSIGEWVLREACIEAMRWHDRGLPIQVSVNVSVRQFGSGTLPAIVATALSNSGLPSSLLKLEITESLFMRNIDKVATEVQAIRETGVSFAMDDFGTGYSSLQYLDRLPIDCLKIDKSFVQNMCIDGSSGELVTAIVSMAHAFGMSSIAEGVETQEQLEALRERGCDQVQGYLFSRPLPSNEFRGFAGIPSVMAENV